MNNILVPVDLSDSTPAVLAAAEEIARAMGARLYLVHVASVAKQFAAPEFGLVTSRDEVARELRGEHRQLQVLEKQVKAQGFDVVARLLEGEPVAKILAEAERLTPKLIIVGSHGHGALYHLLLGSTSEGVLRRAPCPVLVVPARRPKAVRGPAAAAAQSGQ